MTTRTIVRSLSCRVHPVASAAIRLLTAETVATLPERFSENVDGPPDVVMVDGSSPSWPSAAIEAAGAGALGVLVVRPVSVKSADAERVRAAAGETGTLVAMDRRWSSDPLVAALSAHPSEPPTLVHCTVQVSTQNLDDLLLDQIGLVHRLVRIVPRVDGELQATTHGFNVGLRLGDGVAFIAGTFDERASGALQLTAYTADGERHVTVDDRTILNSYAHVVTPAGQLTLPPAYQNGHRATWIRVHDAIRDARNAFSDLDAFIDELNLVTQLTSTAPKHYLTSKEIQQ